MIYVTDIAVFAREVKSMQWHIFFLNRCNARAYGSLRAMQLGGRSSLKFDSSGPEFYGQFEFPFAPIQACSIVVWFRPGNLCSGKRGFCLSLRNLRKVWDRMEFFQVALARNAGFDQFKRRGWSGSGYFGPHTRSVFYVRPPCI